ncbi:hypothetical protein UlMin_041114 [Ulmus minor]
MASTPSNKIDRVHQMYHEGRYEEALGFYTEALAMAAEECTSVLELDQNHIGALMLRAQTLVTHKEYHSALFDVNWLIELNPSSEVYQILKAPFENTIGTFRFLSAKSLAPIPESKAKFEEEEENEYKEEADIDLGSSTTANAYVISPKPPTKKAIFAQRKDLKVNSVKNTPLAEVVAPQAQPINRLLEKDSKGWQAIPKPKGHSTLDYGRWNRVEDEDDEEDQPQDRFRIKTVGV